MPARVRSYQAGQLTKTNNYSRAELIPVCTQLETIRLAREGSEFYFTKPINQIISQEEEQNGSSTDAKSHTGPSIQLESSIGTH
jgi:hypothetical protein